MARKRKQNAVALTEEQKKAKAEAKEALKHCKCGKLKDFEPIVWRVESVPEQRLRDKLAHDENIERTGSWHDPKAKCFVIEYPKCHEIVTRTFTYEDVCARYGWKSFKISKDGQTITPKW